MEIQLPIIRRANSQSRAITAHVTEEHTLLEGGWYATYRISFPVSAGVASYLVNTRRISAEAGFFRAGAPEAGDAMLFPLPGGRYAGIVFNGRQWNALELPSSVVDFWFDERGNGALLMQTNESWLLQPDTAIGLHAGTILDWFARRIAFSELQGHYMLGQAEQECRLRREKLGRALELIRAHKGQCRTPNFGEAERLISDAIYQYG